MQLRGRLGAREHELAAARMFGLEGVDADGAERRCPDGTIPIRRLDLATMARFRTVDDFRRKHPSHLTDDPLDAPDHAADASLAQSPNQLVPRRVGATGYHQYASTIQFVDNHGSESALNLWSPFTEKPSEFSLSQVWVVRGSPADDTQETVEAGWQAFKDLYGDWQSHLFIYFTPDNYGSGGCYNLTCDGFVQVNSSVIIGGGFTNYSVRDGDQYDIRLLWMKDGVDGDWWLRYEDAWVGYYPRAKFDANGIQSMAGRVDFGGEIIDTEGDGVHTRTDMGSGSFASLGWQRAAYHRNIRYVDTNRVYQEPTLTVNQTDSWCYDLVLRSGGTWGTFFYFGGSGLNTECQ